MGFPSPAQDYVESRLSLDGLCGLRSPSVYLMKYSTESLLEGIKKDALLVVDSARQPVNGSLVVVDLDGEFHVRRYVQARGAIRLELLDTPTRGVISEETCFEGDGTICFGVVTYILNALPFNAPPQS
ncbi:S24 family peptidase [Pantoea septica]|uniref:S24 family peptidase n=1 Tax=Pantoea septica TaxID=472695 RepID=UPI0023F8D2F2|nr:S24 family peptidase [Pantoea septica]